MTRAEYIAQWFVANPDRKVEYMRRENLKRLQARMDARAKIKCACCQVLILDAGTARRKFCGKPCIETARRQRRAAQKLKAKMKLKLAPKVRQKAQPKPKRIPVIKPKRPTPEPIRIELAAPETWLSRRLRSRF